MDLKTVNKQIKQLKFLISTEAKKRKRDKKGKKYKDKHTKEPVKKKLKMEDGYITDYDSDDVPKIGNSDDDDDESNEIGRAHV